MVTSIVLAGGGTAGHTSPLIATAKELSSLADVRLLAIGTAKGLETTVIPAAGLELALIDPVPLPRTVNLDLVKLPYTLTKAVRQARRILKRADADVLVGVGGYVSLPAYIAARAWFLKDGQNFSDGDVRSATRVALIGKTAADNQIGRAHV